MTVDGIDTIARSFAAASSRRALLATIAGGILALTNRANEADSAVEATKAKKKTSRHKRCPSSRRCPTRCCRKGQTCQQDRCRRPPRPPDPDATRVRRDIHSLAVDGPELRAFARGVAAMQQQPADHPTSWAFQVGLHADVRQHEAIHFLSWHRMYLYWFERILRQASGDQGFALPYWNYSRREQRVLPAPFRQPENALYVAERAPWINAGEPPDPSLDFTFDTSAAMATVTFEQAGDSPSFGGGPDSRGQLEQSPHNYVHKWVGGDDGFMRSLPEAPGDPLFWVHHANIDRLWEEWLRLGGPRANPTGGPFLTTTFSFFDEHGAQVQMTGQQILDTVGQLGYRYDDQPAAATRQAAAGAEPAVRAAEVERTVVGSTSTGDSLTLGKRPVSVRLPVRRAGRTSFQAARTSARARTTLILEGVAGGGVSGVTYAVHVGAGSSTPSPGDRSFVGAIGLFGLQPWDHPGHGPSTAVMRFDATRAIAAAASDKQVVVTLVPVDFSGTGRLPGGTWATIGRIVVSVEAPATDGAKKSAHPKRPASRPRSESDPVRKRRDRRQPAEPTKKQPLERRRRQKSTERRRTVNRKQPQRALGTHVAAAPEAGPHHATEIPGNKRTAFSLDPAETAATSHAQH